MAPIDLVGDEIAHLTDFFKRTRNPAAAWRVFSLARKCGRAVPEIIQQEIDRFASCISAVVSNVESVETTRGMMFHDRKERDHAKLFGPLPGRELVNFKGPELYEAWRNGMTNPMSRLQAEWHEYNVFVAIQELIENGEDVVRAQEIIADQVGVRGGLKTVQEIWRRQNHSR